MMTSVLYSKQILQIVLCIPAFTLTIYYSNLLLDINWIPAVSIAHGQQQS